MYQNGPKKGTGKWLINILAGPYTYGKRSINDSHRAVFYCQKCRSEYGKLTSLNAQVENWDPYNPESEPEVTILLDQDYLDGHKCSPNKYDHLALVQLKTMQKRISKEPTKTPRLIYKEVYDLILEKYGPTGD